MEENKIRIDELTKQLSSKHLKFANGILGDKTQEQAYIDAGYSAKQARTNSTKLLNANERINEYIELHKQQASDNTGTSIEWVRERLKIEATLSTEQDEKATHSGRIKALELLGKDEGMFVDRKEIKLTKPIEDMTLEEKVELYNVIASKN